MRINAIIATAIVTAMFGFQAWMAIEIVNLKIEVARISEHLHVKAEAAQNFVNH